MKKAAAVIIAAALIITLEGQQHLHSAGPGRPAAGIL